MNDKAIIQKNTKGLMIGMLSLIYSMQILMLYGVYKLVTFIIINNSIEYDSAVKLPFPTTGQWIMLVAFLVVVIISFLFSMFIRKSYKDNYSLNNLGKYSIKDFIFLNSIAISVLLIYTYLFFDSLISSSIFILLFLFLVYFGDKN